MAAASARLLPRGRLPIWVLLFAAGQGAHANPVGTENVTARLVAERTRAAPGETLDLALVLDIRPGWHTCS
jgi:thiol:disulfide interchange protein DsbD